MDHGANCTITDRNGHTPLDLVPSDHTSGEEEGEIVDQMTAILKSAAEKMREREREAAMPAVEGGGSEGGEVGEGGGEEEEEDKENAMEVELPVMVVEPAKTKVCTK